MSVVAVCLACGAPCLTQHDNGARDQRGQPDPHVKLRRTCACPWQPRGDHWARLPAKQDDKRAGRVECIRAWQTPDP